MKKELPKNNLNRADLKLIIPFFLLCFFGLLFVGWLVVVHSSFTIRPEIILLIDLFFIFVFLFVSGSCYFFFYKHFLKPLRIFRQSIAKIKGGDYNFKISLGSKNEFSYFADFFNEMRAHFQEVNTELENTMIQRAKDLDKVVAKLWSKNSEMKDEEVAMLNLLEDSRSLEMQLKEEKDRVNAIIASMEEGLITTDITGKVVFINSAAEKILEISKEKAIGQELEELTPLYIGKECENKVPFEDRPVMKSIKSGQSISTSLADDFFLLSKTGKKIAVILSSSPLLKEGKVFGGVAIFRDVSIEKHLDEAKNGFISIASHQMRTPLTSMRWFSEMLISGDAGAINKEQRQYIGLVYQGIERMISLLNLLLQIARVEAGRVKIEPAPIVFKEIIEMVVVTLHSSIKEKLQTVKIILKPAVFPVIFMDREVIWQVFQNLLSNASRYAPEKGVITVTAKKKGDMAEFSIADKGIGIPLDAQGRIFNKFFRAENAAKLVPEGSGLGLSLVKTLVEEWGGKIWFKSLPGKGTTFYFTVPLAGMKARAGEVSLKV